MIERLQRWLEEHMPVSRHRHDRALRGKDREIEDLRRLTGRASSWVQVSRPLFGWVLDEYGHLVRPGSHDNTQFGDKRTFIHRETSRVIGYSWQTMRETTYWLDMGQPEFLALFPRAMCFGRNGVRFKDGFNQPPLLILGS